MATDESKDILDQLARMAEKHFAAQEREAAWDLIRDAFGALPWELQDLYAAYVETYNAGRREQASQLFEEWMDKARELGLI